MLPQLRTWFLIHIPLVTLGVEDSRMTLEISSDSDSAISMEDSRLPDGRRVIPSHSVAKNSSRTVNSTRRDKEWKYMIHTNPYTDVCRLKDFSSKISMRLCILQQMWLEQLPPKTRRSDEYDLLYELDHILPARRKTDGDNMDCLINSRTKMISQRQVPYDCYKPYPDIQELDYEWFLYEIENELRFTFDYVLYDATGNTQNQAKFWYLMLYLKKMATELPNPFMTAKIINEINERKAQYKKDVLDLKQQIVEFRRDIRYEIRSLLQAINDFKSNIEVVIHMEKLNINSNIFEYFKVEKPWYILLGEWAGVVVQQVVGWFL